MVSHLFSLTILLSLDYITKKHKILPTPARLVIFIFFLGKFRNKPCRKAGFSSLKASLSIKLIYINRHFTEKNKRAYHFVNP